MAGENDGRLASDEDVEIAQNLLEVKDYIDEILERIEEKFTEISWRASLH